VTCEDVDLFAIQIDQYFPPDTSELVMRNNDIEDFPATFFLFGNLGQLTTLSLHDNPLRSLTPFIGIPELTTLEITGGDFTSLQPDLLLNVRKLAVFILSSNPFLNSLPDSLLVGTSLFQFNLVGNPSLHYIPERLFMCTNNNIRFAEIANNGLTSDGIPRNIFDGSSTLTTIQITNEHDITHIKASWFPNLAATDILIMTSCSNLEYIEEKAFDGFSAISRIILAGNDITNDGIPDDLFVNIAPVSVDFSGNNRITEYPAACLAEGVGCTLPPGITQPPPGRLQNNSKNL